MARLKVERRGATMLKTVQIERSVGNELRELARTTGKPMRWHLERAIASALDISRAGYLFADHSLVADETMGAPDAAERSLSDCVAAFYAICDREGVTRPHVQTARKHLRAAVGRLDLNTRRLYQRKARDFTRAEDETIIRMRATGHSLREIGDSIKRGPGTVLRRLRALRSDF